VHGPTTSTTNRAGATRHGSLVVPRRAEKNFEAAAAYLSRDAGMRRVIARAEREPYDLRLKINRRDDDSYDPNTRTVNWDPYSALRTTGGGNQSPALGLGHELAHAAVSDRTRDRGAAQALARYDDAEERRVIRGVEMHAARTLGEAIRHDHRGTCFRVASPLARSA